jgi:hypothetical protein
MRQVRVWLRINHPANEHVQYLIDVVGLQHQSPMERLQKTLPESVVEPGC